MDYSDDILDKVRSFGVLGYSVDKIIDLISPADPEGFRKDFLQPDTPLHRAFRKGKTTGGYNLDKELFDDSVKRHSLQANELLQKRMAINKINDIIFDEFGI